MFAIVSVMIVEACGPAAYGAPRENVPFVAVIVIWTLAPPASGSAIETALPPVNANAVSSSVVAAAGRVMTGASFVAVTVTDDGCVLLSSEPSLTFHVSVRDSVTELCDVLDNWTVNSAAA